MTSEMQDMAISIATEALLKNNSETDVAADIKAAFESNTMTTRARRVRPIASGDEHAKSAPSGRPTRGLVAGGIASSGGILRAT